MNKIWIDPDLLENKSGIGRDSQLMVDWLNTNFDCEIVKWPDLLPNKSRIRRKLLLGFRLIFGNFVHLPNRYEGVFYQSQLGPLLPGKEISVWIVRLHDLFPATNPEWFRWWATKVFKASLNTAVKRKAIFLCDSTATEAEVKKLYAGQILNTFVIPCRLPNALPTTCGSCETCKYLKNSEVNQYFLSVGTIEPRKNYSFALSAWKEFATNPNFLPSLIVVGKSGWKTKKLQEEMRRAADKRVIWFSDCCDGALEKLYKGARALISFSLAEGFDLPPMEARQRYGRPLILSDIPVHREFHDGSAIFFKGKNDLLNILEGPLIRTEFSNYADSAIVGLELVETRLRSML